MSGGLNSTDVQQTVALAYDHWLRRHRGSAEQDWLKAEAEILQQRDATEHQHELRIARDIQQRLLPQQMPDWHGFTISGRSVPANVVGGDCFDFIPMHLGGGECLGVVVADASGHGIGPALVVAETRAYLRALTLPYGDIGTLLALTNRRLTEDRGADYFVTVLLVQLDAKSLSLTYGGAGHCPGFVLDSLGEIKNVLTSEGMPLGVETTNAVFPTACVALQVEDLIFLYTDGIVDVARPGGDAFGIERVLSIVRQHQRETPTRILDALFKGVNDFTEAPLDDDITAVIIKVNDVQQSPQCTRTL